MSSIFSVSDLLTSVAGQCSCPPFGASTRVTQAQAVYWLAQSARSLCALLRQKHGDDREFLQYTAVQTIPGLPLVSLPADCGEVHSVVWVKSADDAVLLPSAGAEDLIYRPLADGVGWDDEDSTRTRAPRWRLEGQTIAFYPASGAEETIEIFYTSHISPTTGTFQGRLDFDRWVELDVAAKVAQAKRKPDQVAAFHQQKALLENDLFSRARKRDVAESHTIRDVRSEQARLAYMRRYGQ